jgi:DNA mismatch repair ATPase MutS
MLRTETAFYIGCLNLRKQLLELQEPICFPIAKCIGVRELSFAGLYDVSLALSAKRKVVGNDINVDGKDVVIITGANTGGKSTFLRSLGQAQLMMQAGMFVAATEFRSEIRNAVCTHFRREEDAALESGKLDEELRRMSDIMDKISSRSVVLFNESFSATNEREGSEIARQITSALVEGGVKVFFVTHLYEFAREFYDQGLANAAFLRAERKDNGSRTFRMVEAEPLQTSYGEDLYDAIFGGDGSAEAKATAVPAGS